jgi:hypothetical protein
MATKKITKNLTERRIKVMRINQPLINELKTLLEAQFKRTFTNEDAQRIGLSVLRFVYAKESSEINQLKLKENETDEN